MASAPATKYQPRSRPPHRDGVHCVSAHIHQVGADASLKGVRPLVRSRCTFPSRLPDPGRLAVPTRPVVVGAAPTRALRFQGQAAPSFNDPLRRAAVGSLIPLDQSTPRGALRALSATGQVAGAATETSTGSKPIVQNGLPNYVLPEGPNPGRATVRPAPDRPSKMQFHATSRGRDLRRRARFRNSRRKRA